MMNIQELSKKYYEKTKADRHYLHQNPELSFQEYQTIAYIKEKLDELEIPYQHYGDTGIVASIKGYDSGKCVLLRADIDALPIFEQNECDYASINKGVMHACGHDGHAASLLGAARILKELSPNFKGEVKLLFQPGEEEAPGGALEMIEKGALEGVDAAFGMHLWGDALKGEVLVKSGVVLGSASSFDLRINGLSAHAASPNLGIDPIVIASEVILSLQTIVSRLNDPIQPLVVSVCSIHAGNNYNVIPEYVDLKGTVRVLNDELRLEVEKQFKQILDGYALMYQTTYHLEMEPGYPVVYNDELMSEVVRKAACKIVGSDKVKELEEISMGGEDFAYFNHHVPSAFYLVGIADNIDEPISAHHPLFDFDDEILIESSAIMAQIALDFLSE